MAVPARWAFGVPLICGASAMLTFTVMSSEVTEGAPFTVR